MSKIKLPMYAARLAHAVDGKGDPIPEDIYRVPIVFRNLDDAKAIYEKTAEEMENTILFSVRLAGWYYPEDGRVAAAKIKEVYVYEEKAVVSSARE